MPRTRLIKVFLASPGQLDDEREAVASALEELNQSLGSSLRFRLELVRWETHTTPTIGYDPQDLINRQIPEDYDVFIGILWTRFGTPTPRAPSGTMEEFERARKRWESDPASVSVMFYFKEEPVSPFDVDTGQLEQVQRFRQLLASTALYGTFSAPEDLGRHVRVHLTRKLLSPSSDDEGDRASRPDPYHTFGDNQEVQEKVVRADRQGDTSDEGLLDLVEQGSQQLQKVGAIAQRMTENLQFLTQEMNRAKEELESRGQVNSASKIPEAKRTVNRLAENMNSIASRFEADIDEFRSVFAVGVDAFQKSAALAHDFGEEAVQSQKENYAAFLRLASSLDEARDVVEALRVTTEKQPRVTTAFNHAKKRLSSVLGIVAAEFSSAHLMAREAAELVRATLEVASE